MGNKKERTASGAKLSEGSGNSRAKKRIEEIKKKHDRLDKGVIVSRLNSGVMVKRWFETRIIENPDSRMIDTGPKIVLCLDGQEHFLSSYEASIIITQLSMAQVLNQETRKKYLNLTKEKKLSLPSGQYLRFPNEVSNND